MRAVWRWLLAFAVLLAVLVGCAVNPVTGRKELHLVSEREEIEMGRKNYVPGQQQAGGKYIADPRVAAYVREVGERLAAVSDRQQLPYEFVVLNDSVPNAWAMPGGKIAVNRGLLTELKSEAELAAVIGHEIVHAAGRHAARGMETQIVLSVGAAAIAVAANDKEYGRAAELLAGTAAALLGVKYGRDLELEADHYGMIYMERAGYDPHAAVSLQETFVRLSNSKQSNWLAGLFASHPPSQERVDANRRFAGGFSDDLKKGEAEYRQAMATLFATRDAYKQYDEGQKALKSKEAKDAEKAMQLANAAIKLEPREALFYGLRGDAHASHGHHAEAENEYSEAIKRNPDFYAFYLGRGRERQQRGESALALADLNRANSLLPTAGAHYAAGLIQQNQGKLREAAANFSVASKGAGPVGKQAASALQRLQGQAPSSR
jgi:predicted Zn-dependent protease